MDIVVEAAKVKSPITGKPIEVNRYNCWGSKGQVTNYWETNKGK
jgi:hypothetical protein